MTYYDLIFEPDFAYFIMILSAGMGIYGFCKIALALFSISMVIKVAIAGEGSVWFSMFSELWGKL